MQIKAIHAYHVTLPFKVLYANAQSKGRFSETIVVQITTDHRAINGYGEGLPVKSVTGETPRSVMARLGLLCRDPGFPWHIEDVEQIWDFIDGLPQTKFDNTAICALEMALLDSWGKVENQPVVDLLPQAFRTDQICYGAPISLGDNPSKRKICEIIHEFGIKHVRAKMEARLQPNHETLEAVADVFQGDCYLGIDPNGAWDQNTAFRHLPLIEQYQVRVVEEPFSANEDGFAEFAHRLKESGIGLMACESAPTLAEIERIIDGDLYDRINVKLCRSGGFRRTLKILNYLRQNEMSFQIGCSTGESGILSAAGRALGLVNRDAISFDGSYDAFLLATNTTTKDISFGPGGKAGPLPDPGLGVAIDSEKLERLSNQRIVRITNRR